MGSLFSFPKAPSTTQAVSIPAASTPVTSTAQSAVTDTSANDSTADSAATIEQSASAAREENLLRRDRGIFGTVQTSQRGLLATNYDQGARKTLLGE